MRIEVTVHGILTSRCLSCGEWSDKYRVQGFVLQGEEPIGVVCLNCIPHDVYQRWASQASPTELETYGR